MLSQFLLMHAPFTLPSLSQPSQSSTAPPSLLTHPPAQPPASLAGPLWQPRQMAVPSLLLNTHPPAPLPDRPLEPHLPPNRRLPQAPLQFTFKPPISPLALPQPPLDSGNDHSPSPPDYRKQVARAVSDLQANVDALTEELRESDEKRRAARRELKAARVRIFGLEADLASVNEDNRQLQIDRNQEAGRKRRAQDALRRATVARDQATRAQAATEKELARVQAELGHVKQDLCSARAAASNERVLKPLHGQARQDVVAQLEKLDGYCALGLRVGRTINSYTQQKRMTLRAYYSHLLLGHEKEDARRLAIKSIWPHEIYQSKKRQFNNWLPEFERDGDVAEGRRGRNQQFVSPIQDADSQQAMQTWLEAQKPHTVTAAKFRGFLNNEYLPILSEQGHFDEQYTRVSLRTAGSWLSSLGWVYGAITKGVYTDGHDAPETVVARDEYLECLRSLSALSASVDQSGKLCLPNLKSVEAKSAHRRFFPHMRHAPRVVFVYHDESTIRSQDGVRHGWFKAGTHHLMQKTLGRGLMLSDFLTMDVGFLTAKDPKPGHNTMRAGIKWDVKSKGKYFDADALNEQWLKQALPTFDLAFNPRKLRAAHLRHSAQRWLYLRSKLANVSHKCKHQMHLPIRTLRRRPSRREQAARLYLVPQTRSPVVGVWIFDCATSHTAFAEDALRATKMNVGEGGAQSILRDGWFVDDVGRKVIQKMSKEVDGKVVPKGMRQVLLERGLLGKVKNRGVGVCTPCRGAMEHDPDRSTRTDCCCRRTLECQPDFMEQACRLAEAIRRCGHLVLFLPKFHPELNPIERGWSAIKAFTRKNCTFTWPGLLAMIDDAINSVTLAQIRNYFRACSRFASVYDIVKHNGPLAEHIVRTYRSHRGVTKNDLSLMVSKLVEKANRDRASALDQRHLTELLEILRGIAEETAKEKEIERESERLAAEEAERLAGESSARGSSETGDNEQQGDEEEDGECTSDLEFEGDDDDGDEDLQVFL